MAITHFSRSFRSSPRNGVRGRLSPVKAEGVFALACGTLTTPHRGTGQAPVLGQGAELYWMSVVDMHCIKLDESDICGGGKVFSKNLPHLPHLPPLKAKPALGIGWQK